MSKVSKRETMAELQALLTGLPKYCASMTFTYNGQSYTSAQVVAACTSILSADAAKAQAKAAYQEALKAEDAVLTTDGALVRTVRQVLGLSFESSVTTLAGLGITPRKKPAPLTGAALVARSAKAAATRAARGTSSAKKKAALVGDVTGVTITPVTTEAKETPAAAASATPAAATTPATASAVLTAVAHS